MDIEKKDQVEILLRIISESLSKIIGKEVNIIISEKWQTYEDIILSEIAKIVSDYYHISIIEIKDDKRCRRTTFPRFVAIYIAVEHYGISLNQVKKYFNRKTHATMLHAIRVVKGYIETYPLIHRQVSECVLRCAEVINQKYSHYENNSNISKSVR